MKPIIAAILVSIVCMAFNAHAQGGFANAYPQRVPADPARIERGRVLYSMTCGFCHGEDARGGDGGSNLLRSQIVLDDQNGELIGGIVRSGVASMPKLEFTDTQLADIAAFIHSFRVAGYDASRNRPPSIVIGDAKAGEVYFRSKCAKCHDATGDLKGIRSRFEDARALQQWWLIPGGPAPRGAQNAKITPTVTVTSAARQSVTGRLVRIDDFIVTLADDDEVQHTFRRDSKTKVEVRDPLQQHKQLLRSYSDKDIHDVTAYLETLK